MTMASDGATTIDLDNSVIGVGVYKITCTLIDTKYSPSIPLTISSSLITEDIYDICTKVTVTTASKSYSYELTQSNGTPNQMGLIEPLTSFITLTNNPLGCTITGCRTDLPCGTDYAMISESLTGTNLALTMKTDQVTPGAQTVCLQCSNNDKFIGWYQTTISYDVQYLCASMPRIVIGSPINDQIVYTSTPSSLTGVEIVSQTTTNDATLCPIVSA